MSIKRNICIIDYGSGNIRSVFNALEFLNFDVKISNQNNDFESADTLILPGVGSFGSAIRNLKSNIDLKFLSGLVEENKKKIIGICVGMQLLYEKGFEFEDNKGLGWLQGNVEKIDTSNDIKLPHIGWNNVSFSDYGKMHKTYFNDGDAYFVHSYAVNIKSKGVLEQEIIATTDYGVKFVSIAGRDNIIGFQFHPEKSQNFGLKLLNEFITK